MKRLLILIYLGLSFFQLSINSQTSNQSQPKKRIALVIGNGNYISSILSNPENDAREMKNVLQQSGFEVLEYENLKQNQMKKAIDEFGMKLKNYDVGLFFYAGHGIQSRGLNYLIPIDAELQTEAQVEYDCVQADRVVALMEESGAKVKIIILDACRNNPFERSWTRSANGRGLATMNAPSGTLIAYATSPGNTASDGSGNNGLYTSAILENIGIPDITILKMFQNVRAVVSEKSNKQQIPWESTSLTGDFYFNSEKYIFPEVRNLDSYPSNNNIPSLNSSQFIDERDGQTYKYVQIGEQVWMAENLRATKFKDSSYIPCVRYFADWKKLETPGFCWFDEKNDKYKILYGAYYNWYAVNTGKLCPTGWHVPNDVDLTTLFNYLGGEKIAGDKLKEVGSDHWGKGNWHATNEFCFTALPAGYRSRGGYDFDVSASYWWRATTDGTNKSWAWSIYSSSGRVFETIFMKQDGFPVRCIKDN